MKLNDFIRRLQSYPMTGLVLDENNNEIMDVQVVEEFRAVRLLTNTLKEANGIKQEVVKLTAELNVATVTIKDLQDTIKTHEATISELRKQIEES